MKHAAAKYGVLAGLLCFALACAGLAFAQEQAETSPPVGDRTIPDSVKTLPETVQVTLEYNPALSVMKHNRDTVLYEVRRAYGGYLPAVAVSGGIGGGYRKEISDISATTERGFSDRALASAELTQLLFDGLRTPGTVWQNEATLESVKHRFFDNAEVLSLDAIVSFLEVLRNQQLASLSEHNVTVHREILGSLEERQASGVGSISDVSQTQGRLSRALATLEENQTILDQSVISFYRVVGALPDALVLPERPSELAPASQEYVVEETLKNNPKIKAYKQDIEVAEHGVTIARSAYFPTFYISLAASTDEWESGDYRTDEYSAMLMARWNLFNGLSDFNAVNAAKSRVRQASSTFSDMERALRQETQNSWRQYESAMALVSTLTDTVDYNNRTREYYRQQFDVGQRSLLDLLDAENEYFQSSTQLVTHRANEYIAIYRLATLQGKLLAGLGIDPVYYDIDKQPLE